MPTILSSEAEFNFIMENQRGLSNIQSYSIGGETRAMGNIDFIHYVPYPIAGGENIYLIYLWFLMAFVLGAALFPRIVQFVQVLQSLFQHNKTSSMIMTTFNLLLEMTHRCYMVFSVRMVGILLIMNLIRIYYWRI